MATKIDVKRSEVMTVKYETKQITLVKQRENGFTKAWVLTTPDLNKNLDTDTLSELNAVLTQALAEDLLEA